MDAPAVAVRRDGKKFAVAWMDIRTGRNDRQVYWSLMRGVSETALAADSKGGKGHPSVAIVGDAVHAAWEDNRSGVQRIHYRTWNGKDVVISPEKGKASFPSLAYGKAAGVAFEHEGRVVFVAPVTE